MLTNLWNFLSIPKISPISSNNLQPLLESQTCGRSVQRLTSLQSIINTNVEKRWNVPCVARLILLLTFIFVLIFNKEKPMAENIRDMMDNQAKPGVIEWIGLRPEKRAPLQAVSAVKASTDDGLEGDHYHGISGERHVTLIQAEHLEAVSSIMGKDIDPGQTRRNVVVSGINLLSLKDHTFRLGKQALLEMTGLCHPCSRMEENLGEGGYNAMRGHAGITARVLQGGEIQLGDEVVMVSRKS